MAENLKMSLKKAENYEAMPEIFERIGENLKKGKFEENKF